MKFVHLLFALMVSSGVAGPVFIPSTNGIAYGHVTLFGALWDTNNTCFMYFDGSGNAIFSDGLAAQNFTASDVITAQQGYAAEFFTISPTLPYFLGQAMGGVVPAALQSIRLNAAGTAFEAYTPSGSGVPTSQGSATNLNLWFGIPSGKLVFNGGGNFWIGSVDQVFSLATDPRFLYDTNGTPILDWSGATNRSVAIKTNLHVSGSITNTGNIQTATENVTGVLTAQTVNGGSGGINGAANANVNIGSNGSIIYASNGGQQDSLAGGTLHAFGSYAANRHVVSTNGFASYATNFVLNANTAGFTNAIGNNGAGGTNAIWACVTGTSGTIERYNRSGALGSTVCGNPWVTNTLATSTFDFPVPVNAGFVIRSGVGVSIQLIAQ